MNAAQSPTALPPHAYQELTQYLRRSGSTLSTTEATIAAIRLWMATQEQHATPLRGYQWKTLFLPDTSKLRMHYAGQFYYAEVEGEELLYQGRAMSPSQFAKAVAGDGRNAWRDLWIRLPGEKHWTLAAKLRGSADHTMPPLPEPSQPSQIEAVSAAARSMSQALQAALLLVEHSNAQSERKYERRAARHRRLDDFMVDDCKND